MQLCRIPPLGSLILALLFGNLHAAEDPALATILEELKGPISILLPGGNSQSGRVMDWDGERLRLEVNIAGGSAEMTFPREDLLSIRFTGNAYFLTLDEWTREPARTDDAMRLFRGYYEQRGAYFSLMSQQELGIFVRYAQYSLEKDEPLRAVAIIEALRPYIQDEDLLTQLDDSLMLAFFKGGMAEEAETKAREWIQQAEPAGNTALGWRILAEIHFNNEDYEKAFWTAMLPIAFSNQIPTAHLDACYAFAILSAEEIRLKEEPERLATEMRDRSLPWPDHIAALKGLAPEYDNASLETEEPSLQPEGTGPITMEEAPLETPSPVDPIDSLPTRIQL